MKFRPNPAIAKAAPTEGRAGSNRVYDFGFKRSAACLNGVTTRWPPPLTWFLNVKGNLNTRFVSRLLGRTSPPATDQIQFSRSFFSLTFPPAFDNF